MRDSYLRGFRRCRLVSAAASLALCGPLCAETLMLKDGGVIRGEILTLKDDVYVVKTESLGTVRVQKRDVRTIDSGDGAAPGLPAGATSAGPLPNPAELNAMQSLMMQNPDVMSMIDALQHDPEVQAVLADPQIKRALAAGDYAALMNHPKILALAHNTNVLEIVEATQ